MKSLYIAGCHVHVLFPCWPMLLQTDTTGSLISCSAHQLTSVSVYRPIPAGPSYSTASLFLTFSSNSYRTIIPALPPPIVWPIHVVLCVIVLPPLPPLLNSLTSSPRSTWGCSILQSQTWSSTAALVASVPKLPWHDLQAWSVLHHRSGPLLCHVNQSQGTADPLLSLDIPFCRSPMMLHSFPSKMKQDIGKNNKSMILDFISEQYFKGKN